MTSRDHAIDIWQAAIAAVKPRELLEAHFQRDTSLRQSLLAANRILVVGAGKAGGSMSEALEALLAEHLPKVTGIVNVPENAVRPLKKIRLHAARPAAINHPTAAGVEGAEQMLALLRAAGPEDIAICLISGGGSALLPAPDGVTLEDKQAVTKLLHACGATIHEMNAVRKHLSRIKGGRLAQAFRGRDLISLIISDVVGDPLDVIASGPTAADPSTFADALAVLERFGLTNQIPAVVAHLERAGTETLKALPANVRNVILGNNALALRAAARRATELGYRVMDMGSAVTGETRNVAANVAKVVDHLRAEGKPACVLIGGETTVTLGDHSGKGGRNQEFVLALLHELGEEGMRNVVVLSGGTDGEDGPTDAAGAIADETTWPAIRATGLSVEDALQRHDAYPLFDAIGGLIRTGLTETNVMDVRVILITSTSSRAS